MMKLWKRLRKNHKGFTLVELICTIAIFSIVVTGVGSAMVISARSYSNGNVELDLQQQAQITSNLLTNLIIDADKVVSASGSVLTVEKVESGVTVTYTVYLDGDQIVYQKDSGTPQILAENVTGFTVDNNAGNDNVDFTLEFTEGGRTYESDYHVTPRNGVTAGGASMSGTAGIYVENKLILEPGQTYDLNVRVTGTSIQGFSIQNLTGNTDTTGTTVSYVDTRTARITVGTGETGTGSNASFRFQVVADDGSAAPQDVEVLVRRINTISVNGYKTSGTVNKAGAVYKISANLAGTNLEKEPGAWYDVDYVDPYTAEWTFDYSGVDDSGNAVSFDDYFEIVGSPGVDGNIPYVIIRTKQNLAKTPKLVVTCTALHPEGTDGTNNTNKSGLKYDTVSGVWELEYQAWKRNGKIDIAIHHLGEPDITTSWADGKPHYVHTDYAKVYFWAYNRDGEYLEAASKPYGMNPWTTSENTVLDAEIDGANIRDIWSLVLNVNTSNANVNADLLPYSTPYVIANITDRWANGETPDDTGGYAYRFNYGGNAYKDVAKYVVRVDYRYTNEDGELVDDSITDTYEVEDVTILFRNALASGWQRDNVVYVTEQDSIEDYKVYFNFDRGWEGGDCYFNDLGRFVGIVADKPGYYNDIRRDITVSGATGPGVYTDGNSYLTFTLTAADKAECKSLTQDEGGQITVKYEYNPYFGKMNMNILDWSGSKTDLSNFEEVAPDSEGRLPGGLTQAQMDAITGCSGSVIFRFRDPNITGTTVPKVMYCPTVAEYGTVYYIDDTTRFVISETAAQYQEQSGGVWNTTVNLTWNGTGWTAN